MKSMQLRKNLVPALLSVIFLQAFAFGATYYVSSSDGNDNNTGISEAKPWKTLDAVNSRTFKAGDKILFKAGSKFSGRFAAQGCGSKGLPIVVDKYGEGNKPHIQAGSSDMEAVLLENVQQWEINNLEISSKGPQVPNLAGVRLHIKNFGTAQHIYLSNLYVHDVNGPHSNVLSKTGCGIVWHNEGRDVPSAFDDLRIENCHVKNVNCRGIQGKAGYSRKNWHPSTNVVIRNNLVELIGGAGITTMGTKGCIIEYNRVRDIGIYTQGNGIHPYSSDDTIIQFNEVSGCRTGETEGWGFNSDDYCNNSLFQYNYSHDNEGGFQLVIGSNVRNTVIRYNISQNDGFNKNPNSPTFNISGACKDTLIYNNTIYVGTKRKPIELVRFKPRGRKWADGTKFYNNIFYVAGEVTFTFDSSTNNIFRNNCWYGKIVDQPIDPCGITDNPLLADPNNGGGDLKFDWNVLAGYKLKPGSPCLGAGMKINIDPNIYKNGGRDFWGDPVPHDLKNPDIGAYQHGKK